MFRRPWEEKIAEPVPEITANFINARCTRSRRSRTKTAERARRKEGSLVAGAIQTIEVHIVHVKGHRIERSVVGNVNNFFAEIAGPDDRHPDEAQRNTSPGRGVYEVDGNVVADRVMRNAPAFKSLYPEREIDDGSHNKEEDNVDTAPAPPRRDGGPGASET